MKMNEEKIQSEIQQVKPYSIEKIKQDIVLWTQESSIHGVSSIAGAKDKLRKFFWIALLLVGIALSSYLSIKHVFK